MSSSVLCMYIFWNSYQSHLKSHDHCLCIKCAYLNLIVESADLEAKASVAKRQPSCVQEMEAEANAAV